MKRQELAELLVVGELPKAALLGLVSQSLKERDLVALPQTKLMSAKEQPQVEMVLCWVSKKTVCDVESHERRVGNGSGQEAQTLALGLRASLNAALGRYY